MNTPDVLFADIDFEYTPRFKLRLVAFLLLLLISVASAIYAASWIILGIGGVLSLLLTSLVAKVLFHIQSKLSGTPEQRALASIQKFSNRHPTWHLRVYLTPKGYRVLVMHQTFEPNSEEVQSLFNTLKADPNYVRMCKNQNCFRARISPKPWRIGVSRLRLGVWPVSEERLVLRENWVRDYQKRAENYASCKFVAQLGSQTINIKAKRVQSMHDQYCKSDTRLDIA